MVEEKTIGVILAGGASRRYGSPKAFATSKGKMFYEIAYQIAAASCDEVVIVTQPKFVERFPTGYDVITDVEQYAGCGPLAGIYSAMRYKRAENYVVLPCDMPLLTASILKRLQAYHKEDVTVTVADGYVQPLVSLWRRSTLSSIQACLDARAFNMSSVLERVSVVYVEKETLTSSPYAFMNVNTVQDKKEMRKWQK